MLGSLNIVLLLVYCSDAIKLELSTEHNAWSNLAQSCRPVDAGMFCSQNMCSTDNMFQTDFTKLPVTFRAWINGYLIKSASIVYQGCFSMFMDVISKRYTKKFPYSHVIGCVHDCSSSSMVYYPYIGVYKSMCYCMTDPITPDANFMDITSKTKEGTCLHHEDHVEMFEILKQDSIEKDQCPLAYLLSSDIVNVYLDDCNNNNTFLCVGTQTGIRASTWPNAYDQCKSSASILANKFETSLSPPGKYWINGLVYKEYEIEKHNKRISETLIPCTEDWSHNLHITQELPLFDTRCAAIVRTKLGFFVEALNCSLLLPTLCEWKNDSDGKFTLPTYPFSYKTTSKGIMGNPTTTSDISTVGIVYNITKETDDATTDKDPQLELISIVIPTVTCLVLLTLVITIVLYRRRSEICGTSQEGTLLRINHDPEML